MVDLEERATALADETLDRIAFRLRTIWKKWGAEDYPEDSGVRFRNQMFLFADWMLYLFKQSCSEDGEYSNEWIERNSSHFLSLSSEEFMRCIGICQIHMQAFRWHLHFNQLPGSVYDEASVGSKLLAFGRQLDWIFNVHQVSEDIAETWHGLLVERIENGGEDYLDDCKEHLGLYLAKTSLGWSEASSPEMWDAWACTAFLSSDNQLHENAMKSQQFCDRVFADL